LLAKLKELGLENNTIVMYSTDNGSESFSWPDGGTPMFRGEKDTNWEGGYRVPAVIRWPGVINPVLLLTNLQRRAGLVPAISPAISGARTEYLLTRRGWLIAGFLAYTSVVLIYSSRNFTRHAPLVYWESLLLSQSALGAGLIANYFSMRSTGAVTAIDIDDDLPRRSG
jgi:hypothetical protein